MRIAVAMSGGVDSSVAAAILADQGHDVIGLSMQLYDVSGQTNGERAFGRCCTLDDLHDARRVAAAIGIPHYILNLERQFDDVVISNFVAEYTSGRTPLPCARCNSDLKFAALLSRAIAFDADAVATGHYAQVVWNQTTARFQLRRGADPTRDQSYFLFSLTQEQLGRAAFPVGDRDKSAVRAYARGRGLPVADKPDSQDICFIPDDDHAAFVAARAPEAVLGGTLVDQLGRVVGTHSGVHRFTVGQRRGLGLSMTGIEPMYVLALKPADRQVVVGPKAALERVSLTASHVNWIGGEPDGAVRLEAQIRHRHRPAAATVRSLGDARAHVIFDAPQLAVTPGQAVVFYEEDVVAGGGWID
jgi:tRNA-specific 2-thiouridylase